MADGLKRGDVREDGYIFMGLMRHKNGKTYPRWISPLAYEKAKQRTSTWHSENRDRMLELKRAWYQRNKARHAEYQRAWRKRKKDACVGD